MKNKRKHREGGVPGFAIAYPKGKRWQSLLYGVSFLRIKEKVLGIRYELSVAFITPKKMKGLNRRYRRKNASTDILAFPLSKKSGEIYFSMPDAARKARAFGMTARAYLSYLFIHGCLHLEGHAHGRTMERLERKFCRAFRLPHPH